MQLYTVRCSGRYTVRTQMYSAHRLMSLSTPSNMAAEYRAPGLQTAGHQASGVPTAKATSRLLAPTRSCSWRGYWCNLGPVADGGAGQTPVLRVPPLVHGLRAVRSGEAADG